MWSVTQRVTTTDGTLSIWFYEQRITYQDDSEELVDTCTHYPPCLVRGDAARRVTMEGLVLQWLDGVAMGMSEDQLITQYEYEMTRWL